ncbi:serine/threonine protein phosphatase UIS2, putative [Plasmodium ovale]|uniref:Ser/Thr protein phosphatase family protein n=2 Tax=Plasmodium ovale TaxID=36330 RepID=A0A1A8WWS1_PLAOA|nr:Ser/Thr protein phosphatase family protein [Plasmodium ovale curtisi]SBS96814.1 Ser/Thr protein phosphatase family protein [Plasmodium ovale curtisi]SCP05636.1 serine/threonine protein phosphatase UIS2, putative [Plasmodium ovale]
MNITKFFLIFLPLILLKYITKKGFVTYDRLLLNNHVKGLLSRIIAEKENGGKQSSEAENDEEREYREYLQNKGTNEFDKVKYKYTDYVSFTILKSKKLYKHILNEFLVFLGSQYSTDEKIVVHVKLIDILSLLFVHYRDNLSNFDHVINSFQDRNKLMNSIENEFFREFLDERDNYIFEVKNMYYKVDYKDEEKERVMSKKKTIYEIFLKNWRNDGYRFYSINNKRKAYIPKKIALNKGGMNGEENEQNFRCRNLVCSPTKSEEVASNGNFSNEDENYFSNSDMLENGEDDLEDASDEPSDVAKKGVVERVQPADNGMSKKNEMSRYTNNSSLYDNLDTNGLLKFYQKQMCHASENDEGGGGNDGNVARIPGVMYRMKKDFFLNGNSFNVISLINAITSNKDNKVVTRLHEGLKKLGITTFDHLVRYTNIIGIFFSYDIFDELYLQIKLVKEYFGLVKKKKSEFALVEKVEKKEKKRIYGEYKMGDDEMFVPPNCLSAYCKLKSVWIRNRNFTVNIERNGSNSLNFMMLGDIGQGFEEEKDFEVQNMLNLMGFNELKSTVDTMKQWHLENNADFVINLGDNVPNDGKMSNIENFQWHNLMKELFVFRKRTETELNDMLGSNPITKKSIKDFYNEKVKEMNDAYTNGKNRKNSKYKSVDKKKNSTNPDDHFSSYDNDRKKLYEFDEEEEENKNEDDFEAIPFYSIFGEKDYFFFPSEQIQEHYSKRIPGYFMPNNYYCVNYDFTYTKLGFNEDNKKENFRASFIFIDTWSLMVGFPIIRNYRSFREQFNWLSKTLYESAQKSDWIFVIGHHPLISSGRRADNYSYEEHSFHDIIRDFLFNYNVDGYFSAHDHLMEYIKFGNIDLFINGSSSRVLFDNSNMGRGYFGKIIGRLYPVTCYVLKTIHRGLKPKGCNINRYSKWSNKHDIGFSTHKLTKDELITEFINGRTGKPLSHKIILKSKKQERKKFYNLNGYADDRINELEKKIKEFSLKNPELIKYKIDEFNENIKKLNLIMKTLKTKEEKEIFKELLHINNLIFDVSKYISKFEVQKLKIMRELAEKYNIFFNRELVNFITTALEKAIQEENSLTDNLNEEIDEDEAERRLKGRNEKLQDEKKSLELVETLGYNPEQFLEKYDSMTKEERDILQEKVGKSVPLEDYVHRIRVYVNKKNLDPTDLETIMEIEEEEDKEREQQEAAMGEGEAVSNEEEAANIVEEATNSVEEATNSVEEAANSDGEVVLVKEVHMKYKKLAQKEKALSEPNYILLMLSSLKIYDQKKYSLNMNSKKELIKGIASSNFLYNIEKHKTFFQLCIELAPDIKRIISNFGGVGLRLPFFKFMNKLYDEIMKLKDDLDKIST